MKPTPQHPGNPPWKTYDQWKKTHLPSNINMPLTAEDQKKNMLKKFNLKDESHLGDDAWGEINLDDNNKLGWGGEFYNNDNKGGW